MRVIALVNAKAGGGDAGPDRIRAVLAAAGLEAEVRPVPGDAIAIEARRAADGGADAVIAAGGDGTVSAVAGALVGGATPLGVLPAGTFNHFAKDLGLPADLEGAARVIAAGAVRAVDVAELGGRVFVNNSSIGLYPLAVREREARRHLLPKPLAMALAMARTLIRLPVHRLRLVVEGAALPRRTPILFVGNNAYDAALVAEQRRPALDGGALSVVVVRHASRLRLLGLALRALLGRVDLVRDLETLTVDALRVESHHPWLLVSADGEVLRLRPPIEYRIRPRALRVLAPPAGAPE